MFDTLTGRFEGTFRKLRTRGKLHPKQVENALQEMRTALLEADAAVSVVDEFLERVRERSLSAEVMRSLTPAQQVIKIVRDEIKPHHVLMACDAMTGQDAVVQAEAFMREVDTTGFVLTKLDGDARGGAALSITGVTGRPIFFAGVGEKPKDLEPFHPDRMAQRILGMGDVMTLIEKAEQSMDAEKARESAERMLKAQFTLEDFLTQMREVKKLGPLQDLLAMMPGIPGGAGQQLKDLEVDDRELGRAEAIICSMTPEERRNPAIIGGSRRLRIAKGSGTTTQQVNSLLKEFDQAKRMMRTMMGGRGGKGRKMGLPGGFGGVARPEPRGRGR